MTDIVERPIADYAYQALLAEGVDPLMARLYAARDIASAAEVNYELKGLLPFTGLRNAREMASRLADAIAAGKRMLVVADYDADGATACAVAIEGLAAMGAQIDFIVPNRFEYGYGLTPEIVELAAQQSPDIIITVDNGIASVAGVAAAHAKGIEVLVTDHHLPGDSLPDCLIVNPNQPGCSFASKNLAGVGVMFYVLMALRAEMRERGAFGQRPEPNLAVLLDLVALGTVADVVRLDRNNRILVDNGLRRMRSGRLRPGIAALFRIAGRPLHKASTFDLGFTAGPRLNAAGRLDDMSLGIACLLSRDEEQALALAQQLDQLNRERRNIEHGMQDEALQDLSMVDAANRYTLTLYRDDWHQGVVGIVASRLKERYHRPTIVFAPGDEGQIKGSGRSIPGFHMRDMLDLVSKRQPDLILKFGGHAMAAGLSLREQDFQRFADCFEQVARENMSEQQLTRTIEVDGSLHGRVLSLQTAELLASEVWGQGFAAPLFRDEFDVMQQKVVGGKHLKLYLHKDGVQCEGMLFNHADWLPERIDAVYQLAANEWQGRKELQLYVQHFSVVKALA